MKRLQLPKNKLARLAINIVFVPLWIICVGNIVVRVDYWAQANLPLYDLLNSTVGNASYLLGVFVFLFIVPIVLISVYIWFGRPPKLPNIFSNKRIWGRLKPKPRITRSKDD